MYQMKINFPNLARGAEVQIPGLGTFKNGSTVTVDDDQAEAFRVYQASVGMPDQTLLQSFQKSEYVEVSTVQEEKAPPNNPKEGDK